jgi:hypothetical protein
MHLSQQRAVAGVRSTDCKNYSMAQAHSNGLYFCATKMHLLMKVDQALDGKGPAGQQIAA